MNIYGQLLMPSLTRWLQFSIPLTLPFTIVEKWKAHAQWIHHQSDAGAECLFSISSHSRDSSMTSRRRLPHNLTLVIRDWS
jgi:hypothetical protein